MDITSVILSIVIAVVGLTIASIFTYRAYIIAKKSTEEKISRHKLSNISDRNNPNKKYVVG